MPTTPKSITIEFVAKDKGLKAELKAIASEQQKLNKVTQKSAQAQKKAVAAMAEQGRIAHQNAQDIEKLNKKLKKKALLEEDVARRIKHQTQADVERVAAQKKANIAIEKAAIAAKKLSKENQLLTITKKTNRAIIKGLSKDLKAAGVNFKKAGVGAHALNRALKGDAKAMAAVSSASRVLTKRLKGVSTGLFSISNNGRLVVGSFATIRSKMLLISFAAGLVSKAFISNVEAFGKQQDSVQRLASVFGNEGAKSLDEYSSELQKVTTFGDENINAAMAQMGAFGASTKQTKALTEATLDLSAGMGIDLNTAALLVSKSFGTSTNALGRYGVELDSNMTREEKVAAITAKVEERYGGLAKQLAQTTSGQLAQARNAFGDLGENLGAVLAPAVLGVAKGLKILSEALNAKVIKVFIIALATLSAAYYANVARSLAAASGITVYNVATKAATVVTNAFTAAQKLLKLAFAATPWGAIITGITLAAGALAAWVVTSKEADYLLDENGKKVRKLTEAEIELAQAQLEGEEALRKKLALLEAKTEVEKEVIRQGRELSKLEVSLMEEINDKNEAMEEEKRLMDLVTKAYEATLEAKLAQINADVHELQIRELNNELTETQIKGLRRLEDAQHELWEKTKERTEEKKTADEEEAQRILDLHELKLNLMSELRDVTLEFANERAEQARAEAEARLDIIGREEQQELESLRARQDYKTATDAEKLKREKKIIDDKNKLRQQEKSAANKDIRKAFYVQQASAIATIANETAKAVMVAIGTPPGTFTGGMPWSGIAVAMGAAQTAAVLSQKPPLMQYGGMVGGNRHSQGGTMIEAERGEFVINRNAVEAAGTEALNRINSGMSGAGGSSVVINNPILGKDAIEDEIIPQIQEALRRGGDIGL